MAGQNASTVSAGKKLQQAADLDEHGSEDDRHDGHKLDEDVDRGTGGVLERVADGIADDGGLMRVRAFAAVRAALDILLCVIPRAAGIGHVYGEQDAGDEGASEQTAERGRAEQDADKQRADDREEAGNDQLAQCGTGGGPL